MNFLTFETFISIPVLIVFYYIGALAIPFLAWFMVKYFLIKIKWLGDTCKHIHDVSWSLLSSKQRLLLIAAFVLSFLFAEVFWRLMFEFLIAYIQIRDALVVPT